MTYEAQDRGPASSTLDGHDPQAAAATRRRLAGRYARRVVAIADRIATRDVELLTRTILSVQTFRERSPLAALRPYLTCCWVQQVPADASPYLHHTVPNGSAELVYTAGSPVRLVGPRTGPTHEILPPGTTVVGIRLRPWAGHRVLGVPVSELVDRSIDAADLLGHAAVVVGDKLSSVASPWAMTLALEDLVVRRLAAAPDLDRVAVRDRPAAQDAAPDAAVPGLPGPGDAAGAPECPAVPVGCRGRLRRPGPSDARVGAADRAYAPCRTDRTGATGRLRARPHGLLRTPAASLARALSPAWPVCSRPARRALPSVWFMTRGDPPLLPTTKE
jgi:Domain of unknown function (DUF6597)